MQGHAVRNDSSQRHAKICSQIKMDVLDCREETYLGEHANFTPLQQHIVMKPHLHHFSSGIGDERWRLVYQ
jgi:hypothetical protein